MTKKLKNVKKIMLENLTENQKNINTQKRNYWLIKSEPDAYSWTDLENEKIGTWDGVRNYQARNNMRTMRVGDQCLFYHSVTEKAVVGVCEICEEAFQDTSYDNTNANWVAVKVKPIFAFQKTVSLQKIKENPKLQALPLLKQTRLSVCPLTPDEFGEIVGMGEIKN